MIRKGVYLYEYMDSCKRFDEKLLPEKDDFYSNFNMEDVTNTDYKHGMQKAYGIILK